MMGAGGGSEHDEKDGDEDGAGGLGWPVVEKGKSSRLPLPLYSPHAIRVWAALGSVGGLDFG